MNEKDWVLRGILILIIFGFPLFAQGKSARNSKISVGIGQSQLNITQKTPGVMQSSFKDSSDAYGLFIEGGINKVWDYEFQVQHTNGLLDRNTGDASAQSKYSLLNVDGIFKRPISRHRKLKGIVVLQYRTNPYFDVDQNLNLALKTDNHILPGVGVEQAGELVPTIYYLWRASYSIPFSTGFEYRKGLGKIGVAGELLHEFEPYLRFGFATDISHVEYKIPNESFFSTMAVESQLQQTTFLFQAKIQFIY